MTYPPELRKRITFVAFAPGAFTDEEYCKTAYYYTSTHDFVSYLDWNGMKRNERNFHVLERHKDASWFDHSFSSPSFTDTRIRHIKDFLKN